MCQSMARQAEVGLRILRLQRLTMLPVHHIKLNRNHHQPHRSPVSLHCLSKVGMAHLQLQLQHQQQDRHRHRHRHQPVQHKQITDEKE